MAVFYNQATLSYAGGAVRSNITTGEISEAVTVSKTAVSGSYTPGGSVVYALSISNAGAAPVTGVVVTDDLGGYVFGEATVYPLAYVPDSLLYYVDGLLQAAPTVEPGPPLVIQGIEVPAGDSVMLIYEARVTPYAPLGEAAAITNTATVTGSCIPTPLTAAATVTLAQEPRLSISKSVDPAVVTGCSTLTYTFVIQNAGSDADAADALVVSDTFDPVLRGMEVTLDGEPMNAAGYSYDETTGVFATVGGAVTVPAAAYAQGTDGSWTVTPGVTVLTVSGTR